MIILEINNTVAKNIHDIQSNNNLTEKLIDLKLIKGNNK